MITAPAPGLEHFGEVLQPLFGESAPARRNFTSGRALVDLLANPYAMSHEPARQEKITDATQRTRINLDVT